MASISSRTDISLFVARNVMMDAWQINRRDGFSTCELLIGMVVSVPFVVVNSERALLFTSGSIRFEAYLLDVVDLVVVAAGATVGFSHIGVFILEEYFLHFIPHHPRCDDLGKKLLQRLCLRVSRSIRDVRLRVQAFWGLSSGTILYMYASLPPNVLWRNYSKFEG